MGKIGSWPEEMLGARVWEVDCVMSIVGDQEWHTGSRVGAGHIPRPLSHTSSDILGGIPSSLPTPPALPTPTPFPAEGRHSLEYIEGARPPRPRASEE